MSDFIEETVLALISQLDKGVHDFEINKNKDGLLWIYGGEVESNVKTKVSLPQLTIKVIHVYLKINNNNMIYGQIDDQLSNISRIIVSVPIAYFDNGEKHIKDIRDTITHEIVHAFNPKANYAKHLEDYKDLDDPKYAAYTTHVGEKEEFIEGLAYTLASTAKGNKAKLINIINQKKDDIRGIRPTLVNDPKLWKKLVKRMVEIWEKYFSK